LEASQRDARITEIEAELPPMLRSGHDPSWLGQRSESRQRASLNMSGADRLLGPAMDRHDDPLADLALARLLLVAGFGQR
jgi:hypothetical protein